MGVHFLFDKVGRVVVAAHTEKDPSDLAWQEYVGFLRVNDGTCDRIFVYTVGGGPNGKQRKALEQFMSGKSQHIAVVTPSRVSRAIGTAISWFNPHIQVFSPGYLHDAMAHLRLGSQEAVDVVRATLELAKRLAIARAAVDLSLEVRVQEAV